MDPESQGVRPLETAAPTKAPPSHTTRSGKAYKVDDRRSARRKFCYCCGICALVWIVIIIVLVILGVTVFRQRKPTVRVTSVTLEGLDVSVGNVFTNPNPTVNVDLGFNATVHNPNYASFKYKSSHLYVYYHDQEVADALIEPGEIKARKTSAIATLVDVKLSASLINSNLTGDLLDGTLPFVTVVQMKGTAKVLNFIKIHNVKSNVLCNVNVFIGNQSESYDCKTKVKL